MVVVVDFIFVEGAGSIGAVIDTRLDPYPAFAS
jgi:hypothetical protein